MKKLQGRNYQSGHALGAANLETAFCQKHYAFHFKSSSTVSYAQKLLALYKLYSLSDTGADNISHLLFQIDSKLSKLFCGLKRQVGDTIC